MKPIGLGYVYTSSIFNFEVDPSKSVREAARTIRWDEELNDWVDVA